MKPQQQTPQGVSAIRNFLQISERIGTSGQPELEQLPLIREAGYDVLINLLPVERTPEEGGAVRALGMEYIQIPVAWAEPTRDNLLDFFAAMDANADKRVYIHCAVNMRVSAFMYLYRTVRLGMPPDDAEVELHDIWVPDGVWKEFIEANGPSVAG
jgi:protein tyrosine phosphatase (PTP) superfamily phosphohydrolase (DUF442 family)